MKFRARHILFLSILIASMFSNSVCSQCPNNNLFYVNLTPPIAGATVSDGCIYGGEYIRVNVVSGQTYTFSTCGSFWDTSITLYNAGGAVPIAFNDDSVECGFQSYITWTATFTGVLRVLVDTWDCLSIFNCATISVTWVGSPPAGTTNDACVNATPIGCGQTVNGNSSTATGESTPICDFFMSTNTNSLWYSFVGSGQNVTASLCGSSFDTDIVLYTGNCTLLSCAGYNDDFCGLASQISWFATAGVTYYIRVAGYSTFDFGAFTLTMQCATTVVTASDCVNAVDVCTNLSFQIDPNGSGSVFEIPPSGSFGNPLYFSGDAVLSPWGSDNTGCLLGNELNSTWMRVNILTSGALTFTFGGLGAQAGFYDWIMYPYNSSTCTNIINNNVAPIRCNWNAVLSGGTGLASVLPPGGIAGNYEPPLNVLAGQQYIICFSNYSSAISSVPLQFGGTAVVGCQNIALPVELVEFEATAVTNAITIDWATMTEVNNDYFTLQRSSDQDNWIDVATIAGHGNSTDKKYYEYLDRSASLGTNYYRLLQFDFNGDMTTSNVVAATMKFEKDLLFPNPNAGSFTIISGVDIRFVRIFNAQGRQVDYEIRVIDAASGMYQINLTNPNKGFYILNDSSKLKSIAFSVN